MENFDNQELIDELKRDIGDYIHLPIEILITKYNMNLIEACIYARIYSFNIKGLPYKESQMMLANKLGFDRKTIGRTLQSLVDKGFLFKKEGMCDKGKMNTYHI